MITTIIVIGCCIMLMGFIFYGAKKMDEDNQ